MGNHTAIRLTELDADGVAVVREHTPEGTPVHNSLLLHSAVQAGLVGRLVVLPAQADPVSGRLVPRPTPQLDALRAAAGAEPADSPRDDDPAPAGTGDGTPTEGTAEVPDTVMHAELLLTLDLATVSWLLDVRQRAGQVAVEVWAVPEGLGEALDPTPWSYSTVRRLDVHDLFVTVTGRARDGGALPEPDDGVVGMTSADPFTARRLTTTPPPLPY